MVINVFHHILLSWKYKNELLSALKVFVHIWVALYLL